jgi:hypothetical protein
MFFFCLLFIRMSRSHNQSRIPRKLTRVRSGYFLFFYMRLCWSYYLDHGFNRLIIVIFYVFLTRSFNTRSRDISCGFDRWTQVAFLYLFFILISSLNIELTVNKVSYPNCFSISFLFLFLFHHWTSS